jgi:hypothetical protein
MQFFGRLDKCTSLAAACRKHSLAISEAIVGSDAENGSANSNIAVSPIRVTTIRGGARSENDHWCCSPAS